MAKANQGNGSNQAVAKKTKTIKVKALSVKSSIAGFRRGGRAWGKDETTVKLSELSKEQITQIKGESMLSVTEVEVDEEVEVE